MNKPSGGDEIPSDLFKILKDDTMKVLHSMCQQIWKLSSGHRTGKIKFSFQSQRRSMPKNVPATIKLCSFHMLVSLCSKILQASLQQYANQELADVQAGFRKGRGISDQIVSICGIIEKASEFQKKHLLLLH